MKYLMIATLFIGTAFASDAEKSELDSKLDSLNIPSDKVTPLISEDKIYAVNSRYSSLNKRFELTIAGANDFTSVELVDSTNRSMTARYHINGKWSVGARYTDYFNKLNDQGISLYEDEKNPILPDLDYAIKSSGLFVNYNTIYGKLRLTKNTVLYFDHFVALGYGKVALYRGEAQMYSLDTGFSFWMGKKLSARFGVNNEFYREHQLNQKENTHHARGYIELGYLFGEGSRS